MQRTRPRTKLEITQKEADFLRSNAATMTIKEMAEDLKVSESKIKDWLKELRITRTRQAGSKKAEVVQGKPGMFNPKDYGNFITGYGTGDTSKVGYNKKYYKRKTA